MKKSMTLFTCGLLALALVCGPAQAQTSQEVVAKMIEAQGGAKALAAVKDTTINATVELVSMGMNGTLTMYQKEPNMMRMDIEIMGMVITQAYDGAVAWMVNPQTGATEQMPEPAAQAMKRQALGNGALSRPRSTGSNTSTRARKRSTPRNTSCSNRPQPTATRRRCTSIPEAICLTKPRGWRLTPRPMPRS